MENDATSLSRIVLLPASLLALGSCKHWTIRPIETNGQSLQTSQQWIPSAKQSCAHDVGAGRRLDL
jgi:hypothetical protein